MQIKYLTLLLIVLAATLSFASNPSPYAGQEKRTIKSFSANEIKSLRSGEGMGFAKLAELNHYPGPKHVLELAQQLELTPSQLAETEALFAEMRTSAIALGEDLLNAEAALDRAFASGEIDTDALENALLGIGNIHARLRFVHLEAHLRQRVLLTDAQVSRYDKIRAYGLSTGDHEQHTGHHDESPIE